MKQENKYKIISYISIYLIFCMLFYLSHNIVSNRQHWFILSFCFIFFHLTQNSIKILSIQFCNIYVHAISCLTGKPCYIFNYAMKITTKLKVRFEVRDTSRYKCLRFHYFKIIIRSLIIMMKLRIYSRTLNYQDHSNL